MDNLSAGPEQEPKRGPGRPRKDGSPAQPRDPNAPRRGRPPGRSKSKRSLETEIGAALSMINMVFYFLPPPIQGDQLDEAEIQALAKALNDAAQDNAAIFRYLSYALTGGGSSLVPLLMTVGLIMGRRAARHGILPPQADENLGMLIAMQANPNLAPTITVVRDDDTPTG